MRKLLSNGKILVTYLSIFSVLAASILSVFTGFNFSVKAAQANAWNGTTAASYASGTGTETDPFIIENAAQLHKMVKEYGKDASGNAAYFKLADGVSEIVINDVTGFSAASAAVGAGWINWMGGLTYDISTADTGKSFVGKFDGNGAVIKGLYAYSAGSNSVGFIPSAGVGAEVKNVQFESAYVKNDVRGAFEGAAVVAGRVNETAGSSIEISKVSINNCYISGGYAAAGFIGNTRGNASSITTCILTDCNISGVTTTGGAIADGWGSVTVSNSFFIGIHPERTLTPYSPVFANVYTDDNTYSWTNSSGTSTVDRGAGVLEIANADAAKGAAAQVNMPGLIWGADGFQVGATGEYPSFSNEVIVPPPVVEYTSGTGTASDPFIIENAAQLHKMVEDYGKDENGNPASFMVKDGITQIIVNDATGFDAANPVIDEENFTNWMDNLDYDTGGGKNGKTFVGSFNGNGATIFGLYGHTHGTNSVAFIPSAGSGAIVKNVNFDSAYVKTSSRGAYEGTAVVVGRAYESSANIDISRVSVYNCYVYGEYAAAGIIGNMRAQKAVIDTCIVADCNINTASNKGGAIADGWGSVTVSNSIFIGVPAERHNTPYSPIFSNCYCDDTTWSYSNAYETVTRAIGVEQLANADAAKGDAAKTNMPELTWEKYGEAVWNLTDSYPIPNVSRAYYGAPGDAWSGKFADSYKGGTGTQEDPYLIETAESLAFAIVRGNPDAYYKLTADIYLNDVSAADWYNSADVREWFTSEEVVSFAGKLDGDNHTIYGLYVDAPADTSSALIPVLGSGASVSNLTIADAYIKGAAGSNVGAVAGLALDKASPSSIAAVDVLDSVQLVGGGNVGGIIGKVGATAVRINNVAFKGSIDTSNCTSYGAIIAASSGAAYVKNSFAVNAYAFGSGLYSVTNIYTNVDHSAAPYKSENIILLADADMKGDAAKTNMPALAWADNVWQANTDAYPSIVGRIVVGGGAPGEIWTGEIANDWAGGTGTQADPYQIATAEQLAKFAKEYCTGTKMYYVLTHDIYLNDVESDFWAQGIGLNNWIVRSELFTGEIDGQGHVIYGMYYNHENDPAKLARVGFIGQISSGVVIKNLGFSHAIVLGQEDGANLFAGGIVSFVSYGTSTATTDDSEDGYVNVNGTQKQVPVIENCFIDNKSHVSGLYAGGIVCAPSAPVIVKDCYATCKLSSPSASSAYGAIIGDAWTTGSIIINCFASTQDADPFASGGTFVNLREGSTNAKIVGSYAFSLYSRYGVNKIRVSSDRTGEKAREIMGKSATNPDGLDFDNVWKVVDGGTPVLRVFDKTGRPADLFSDTEFQPPKTTITLQTDCEIKYDPMTGDMFSPVELPTPVREGYVFGGWFVYSDFQCEYTQGYYPPRNLSLYAKWEQVGIIQNFESYSNSTTYDYDDTKWVYNRPGAKGGYKVDFNHGGSKSMHRLNTPGEADVVINYTNPLVVGQTYSMSFWVATDEVGTIADISLVNNTWPDYLEPALSVEKMASVSGLTVGEWTKYTYSFTATTPWISFRTTGDASLYIDDIIITTTGTLVENKNDYTYNGTGVFATDRDNAPSRSPSTGEAATPIVAVVAVLIACAIIVMISKRNLVEVIEK